MRPIFGSRAFSHALLSAVLLSSPAHLAHGAPSAPASAPCAASSFSFPSLFGAQGISIQAEPVQNFTAYPQAFADAFLVTGPLNFCKVAVAYTHPGQNDVINVRVWLPSSNEWNGRYVSTGGGGWVTGYPDGEMFTPWIANGSAVASTDGGHARTANASFALKSPGTLDYNAINNFASIALEDLGVIGKAITQQYYSTPPKFSYWYGCSMGGRQGFQMAQTAPAAYNGILALAPAISVHKLPATLWPQVLLNKLGYFPPPCEFDAILAAVVKSCDGLDGVRDGIISRPDLCKFDVQTLSGKQFDCTGTQRTFSTAGIAAAKAYWEGSPPVLPLGQRAWPGMPIGTPLRINVSEVSLVATACNAQNEDCHGVLIDLFVTMIRFMIKKDPNYKPTVISEDEYYEIVRSARQMFYSLLGTDDTDLSPFKRAGGKILTMHGLTDQLLSPRITEDYVERVKKNDKSYQDYLRYFEMPGVEHCGGGKGAWPLGGFDRLVEWVERGAAPESMLAVDQDSFVTRTTASAKQRLLCLWPKVPKFKGGDVDKAASYTCVSR